ncbi:aromatic amino acid ammonia-lyase [Capnocytophaga sp.]|uniref:aromatic amino acid ammonia-lyase n=1 Tax=Capnocytophaga sp. TaxID=44737 RepID=UPI0026DB7DF7|nr:aromatic amino acid ammonia-lyase [Capnocytophaga sp.]MDO5105844.1 aromatic amino acid ammonia-lyase [Capnocytophaga sp.]
MIHYISNETLVLEHIEALIVNDIKLKLSEEAILNAKRCSSFLNDEILTRTGTDFASENQHNLLKSYACGIGNPVPDTIVKLMLFLKIQSLCYGFSGVRLEIIERFLDFYNNDVLPVVYSQDAPDDRIALAHLALPLIGEGEVRIDKKVFSACELESKFGWKPLKMKDKEAEALLGGTQLTTAYGVFNLIKSLKINKVSDFVSSISVQVFGTNPLYFSEQVQVVRPHKGQIQTAEQLSKIIKNNRLQKYFDKNASCCAPEAFCAIPQVHGAVKDTISYVRRIIKTEVNSTTDNFLVFPHLKQVITGGNSHTLPLSLGLDFLSIALTSLGNISERRIFYLISALNNEKMAKNARVLLDLSVFQRITEGILAENKRLSVPVSVESPIFSEKMTDIKGMGGSSAVKCSQVIKNIEQILAIELLVATLLISEEKITFESDIIKEYMQFLNLNNENESILKKNIQKTVQFFNENEFF